MKVFVRTLTNQKYELEVNPSTTISGLKEEIHKQHQLGEPDSQKLIYSGKILKDDQTLDDAKIRDGGFVVLMTKKGGAESASKPKELQPASQPSGNEVMGDISAPLNPAPAAAPADAAIQNANAEEWPAAEGDDAEDEEELDMDPAEAAEALNQLIAIIQSHPEVAEQLVEQLVQAYPDLAPQLANSNNIMEVLQQPEVMGRVLEMMAHLGGVDDEDFEEGDLAVVDLSEEEMQAIQRLEALGFDRNSCIQAYVLCDRNEEIAANYLFENMYGDEDMDIDPSQFH